MKKQYVALDHFKFLSAILIVSIHAPPFYGVSDLMNFILMQIVARFAVPFFFLTSAFLFFSGLDYEDYRGRANRKRLSRYAGRLLRLYLVWSLLYIPIRILNNPVTGFAGLLWQLKVTARDFLFAGIASHLWFLTALLVAVCLVFLLLHRLNPKTILVLGGILYLVGLLGDSYSFLLAGVPILDSALQAYRHIFVTTNNGIFFGLPFVAAGAYFARFKPRCGTHPAILGFLLLTGCLAAEAFAVYFGASGFNPKSVDVNRWIFLAPAAVFLFAALLQTNWKPTPIAGMLRSMSMTIYLIHPMFLAALGFILPCFGLSNILHDGAVYFFLAVLLSTLSAWTAFVLKGRSRAIRFLFS